MEVFRFLRSDEDLKKGLSAKDPDANVSVEKHVVSGTDDGFKSQFISCCKTLKAALIFAKKSHTYPKRIVKIKIRPSINILDLTIPDNQMKYFPFNQKAKNYANKFKEVLILGDVPPNSLAPPDGWSSVHIPDAAWLLVEGL
ncbi:uncharacterized protein LOC134256345 [Saccostrea cucullata]|uniref:uncharacterized protein LOC134256345 n=1 Tax=Saccostrea cuccullata TaxID=36930 RepID=UPI002ECFDCF2